MSKGSESGQISQNSCDVKNQSICKQLWMLIYFIHATVICQNNLHVASHYHVESSSRCNITKIFFISNTEICVSLHGRWNCWNLNCCLVKKRKIMKNVKKDLMKLRLFFVVGNSFAVTISGWRFYSSRILFVIQILLQSIPTVNPSSQIVNAISVSQRFPPLATW